MMVGERLALDALVDSEDLVVWRHRGDSAKLVLCFSGIGGADQAVPPAEFVKTATGAGKHSVLFIAEPGRTWLNGPGLVERIVRLAEDEVRETGADHVVTLGHSMGGFSALLMAAHLKVATAVAFGPQWSVHPEVAGDDRRWARHRRHIATHVQRGAMDVVGEGTQYIVLHGGLPEEAPQRDRFPVSDSLVHLVVPGMSHQIPNELKRRGLLEPVVRAAMNNRPAKVRQVLAAVGVVHRKPKEFPLRGPSGRVATETGPAGQEL